MLNIKEELKKLDDPNLTLDQVTEMFRYTCKAFAAEDFRRFNNVFDCHERLVEWNNLEDKLLLKMKDLEEPKKLDKATFKKAMQIFADEFNNYFKIGGDRGATWIYSKYYSWKDVRDKIYQQVKADWNDFVDFIDSRLDDEVLDRMVEDGVLEEVKKDEKKCFDE